MGFYENFTRLCRKAGKAPSVVAQEIGLNNSSVTYWKRGSMPKGETLRKLSGYFGVSVDALLEDKADEDECLRESGAPTTTLELGESFKLEKVRVGDDGKIHVTFSASEHGLSAQDFVRLAAMVNWMNRTYGITLKNIVGVVETTARSLRDTVERWRKNETFEEASKRKVESDFWKDIESDSKKGDE